MALKRKGEDPKTKVKITSVKEDVTPNAENKRKMDEYNAASTAYKSAESKYKSDVDAYNKQMKVYNEKNVKGRRDMTFFQDGNRYLNPQELDEYNKRKSEEYGGLKASKVMVSKGYGKSNVDVSSKGEKGSYSGYLGAAHEWFDKPTAPKKQTLAEPKAPNLSLERMPMLKIKKIETTSSKKLAERTPSEEPEQWQAPSRRYTETKVTKSTARNAARNEGKLKSARVSDISLKSKVAGLSYNKEGKEAKAYYGGFEGQTKSDITERRGAIKVEKRELRQGIKDVRRGVTPASESLSKSERIQGYRKEIKNLRAENKQAKQAGKYFDKNLEARSFYDEGREVVRAQAKEKPGAKFFTPEAMKGYRESMNNPANRNTISAKIKKEKK
jgi:hypothetical protein